MRLITLALAITVKVQAALTGRGVIRSGMDIFIVGLGVVLFRMEAK